MKTPIVSLLTLLLSSVLKASEVDFSQFVGFQDDQFDTDGDSIYDDEEVRLGSDPADPLSFPNSAIYTYTALEFSTAVSDASPGDIIVLANGTYVDLDVSLTEDGRPDAPIILRAATAGRVSIQGNSKIWLLGKHGIADGFRFENGRPEDGLGALRINADYCRITNCTVFEYNGSNGVYATDWIGVQGVGSRIDHNRFEGKNGQGPLLTVWMGRGGEHKIDNNVFKNYVEPPLDSEGKKPNGYETIRIGTGANSSKNARILVENNLFDTCDGETEIISIKANENIIRGNTFFESEGEVSIRQGHRNTLEDNVFIANRKTDARGIRINGSDNKVRNNYFKDVAGTSRGAITVHGHSDDTTPTDSYKPVINAEIHNNTIVGSDSAFVIGSGANRRENNPVSADFTDNLVLTTSNVFYRRFNIYQPGTMKIESPTYSGNIFYGGNLGIPLPPSGIDRSEPTTTTDSEGLVFEVNGIGAQGVAEIKAEDVGPRQMQALPPILGEGAYMLNPNDFVAWGTIASVDGAFTFNTDSGLATGDRIIRGTYAKNPDGSEVVVFVFDEIDLTTAPVFVGSRPLVLASRGNIRIDTDLDVSGGDGTHGTSSNGGGRGIGILGGGTGGVAGYLNDSLGPNDGEGPGYSAGNNSGGDDYATGGAGFGGAGGDSSLPGGSTYGDLPLSSLLGGSSAGASTNKGGGAGGGGLGLVANGSLEVFGDIDASGGDGGATGGSQLTSGGGSGGAVLLVGDSVILDGSINLSGGKGGDGRGGHANGGGGGGGRLAIHYKSLLDTQNAQIQLEGGDKQGANETGQKGALGTQYINWLESEMADAWLAEQLSKETPTAADWNTDFDGDGYTARLEYALGDSVMGGLMADFPYMDVDQSEQSHFVFNRRKEGVRETDYSVEYSESLSPGSWQKLQYTGATVVDHDSLAGFERVSIPLTSSDRMFVRISLGDFTGGE
ncbi:MAG: chondroitinase-B domain-containing protein [Opitutales bacterium]